jgi:hypothetical protein
MRWLVLLLSALVFAGCAQNFTISSSQSIAGNSIRGTGNKFNENLILNPEALVKDKKSEFDFFITYTSTCDNAFNKMKEFSIIADGEVLDYQVRQAAFHCNYDKSSTEYGRIGLKEGDFEKIKEAKELILKVRGGETSKEFRDANPDFIQNLKKFYNKVIGK